MFCLTDTIGSVSYTPGDIKNFPVPTTITNTRNVLPICQDKFGGWKSFIITLYNETF